MKPFSEPHLRVVSPWLNKTGEPRRVEQATSTLPSSASGLPQGPSPVTLDAQVIDALGESAVRSLDNAIVALVEALQTLRRLSGELGA